MSAAETRSRVGSLVPAVLLAATFALTVGAFPATASSGGQKFESDRLIVVFDKDVSGSEAREIVGEAGARSLARLSVINGAIVDVGMPSEQTSTLRELELADGVRYVERDQEVKALATPSDPMFPQLWGMQKIEAPAAWDTYAGGPVLVAVTDTGIDKTHPDLDGNLWVNPKEVAGNNVDDDGNGVVDDIHGVNFSGGANSGDPRDGDGHGTHVAGTIAAESGNGIGVVGVNPQAKVLSAKFLGDDGRGALTDAIRAIDYSRSMGAKVINASWGCACNSRAVEEAIARSNALFVAAAGNSGVDADSRPHYPSGYDLGNVVSVAATTQSDKLANFSNYGSCSVDLAAPGYEVLSTIPGGAYKASNGTSMAAPHVAGAAALIAARNPGLGLQEIKARLMDSVDKPASLAGRSVTGGRLNVRKALASTATSPPVGCPPKPKPPVNTAKPVISGVPQVGKVLSVTPGTWDNSPTEIAREWWECQTPDGEDCWPISGATDLTYMPLADSLGSYVFVVEEAWNSLGSATAASEGVGPVAPPPVRELKLSGKAQSRVARTGRLSALVRSTVPDTTVRLRFRVNVGSKAIASGPAKRASVGTRSQKVTSRLSAKMRKKVRNALKSGRKVTLRVTANGQDADGRFDRDQVIRLRIRN